MRNARFNRERRRSEAEERAEQHRGRTRAAQLALIESRPGESRKELIRLGVDPDAEK